MYHQYMRSLHEDELLFIECCRNGNLQKLQNCYDNSQFIEYNFIKDFCFEEACKNNHLAIAKWLYYHEMPINFIDFINHTLFELVCENGHIEIAQWLIHIDWFSKISCHTNEDYVKQHIQCAYQNAIKNNHTNIISWLLETNLIH